MKRSDVVWLTAIFAAIGADVWCSRKQDGTALSCTVRRLFRVHHRVGQLAFLGGWAYLTYWFLPHILLPGLRHLVEDSSSFTDWTPERP